MQLPGVVCVELGITPTSFSNFCGRDFGVVKKNCVLEQQVGNAVTSLFASALDGELLVTTARAITRLILEVVAEEAAEFPLV